MAFLGEEEFWSSFLMGALIGAAVLVVVIYPLYLRDLRKRIEKLEHGQNSDRPGP